MDTMKAIILPALLGAALLGGAGSAQAAGCIKGAVVGGVVGHYAGHHGVLGAAAGCAIGHHEAKVHEREAQAAADARANQNSGQIGAPPGSGYDTNR
jgi:hypothetical protein